MYNTSQKWKENIYKNVQSILNIYIDDVLINPDYVLDFKVGQTLFEENLELGSTTSKYIEFKIYKEKMPQNMKRVKVDYGILIDSSLTVKQVNSMLLGKLKGIKVKSLTKNNGEYEIIPIGIFNIDEYKENDDNTLTIKCIDNMSKFEFNYDGSSLTYPATLIEVLKGICLKAGVELGSTSFLNCDEKIAVYDNTVSAREYIGYIAESAGGFAFIGRDGKLYIRRIYQDEQEIPLELFGSYKWGEEFQVSKLSYEDGVRSYKYGDTTRNNLWINQENMFITTANQIQNIYNQVKDLTANSFEGKTIIDPALDVGDKIIIDGKPVIYQGELDYQTRFIADIKSTISIKQKQETTIKKESQKVLNRRVQSNIDQIEGKISQLVQETTEHEEKLTEHEQTIDSINDKVSNIADLTENATGVTELTLNNCINGELLTLNIYGNNTVFKYQFMSDELLFGDNVTLGKDASILIVTDKENNSTEYNLNVIDELRQNGEVRDEYMIKSGQAQIIRRINSDGTIKNNEEIEDIGEIHIVLQEGVNILKIKYFNAEIQAKWATKSDLANTFATKVEMNTSISQTSSQIMTEVNKKVDDAEFGTKMIQDYESVRIAWNKISDFIKMMVFNNNASLCLVDNSNNVIASFDKEGEHFYKSGEVTPFGEMGVQTVDDKQYIAFSVEGEYEKDIDNGMAWGIKTKSDEKFYPIFYIKDFSMGAKNSDTWGGSLVLTACDILLNGIGTGITTGGVRIEGDPAGGALYFYDVNTNNMMMGIFPQQGARYETINILDKISFFKNQAGSNSFRIGTEDCNCLLSDEGHIMRKRNLCK